MRRLFQYAVVFAMVLAVGGPWAVLQTAAWCSMAINYSRQAPLRVALKETFDGKHPCSLCEVVRKGRSEDRRGPTAPRAIRIEAALPTATGELWSGRLPCRPVFSSDQTAISRFERPPLPPPRSLPG